jgi:hypothetical protein
MMDGGVVIIIVWFGDTMKANQFNVHFELQFYIDSDYIQQQPLQDFCRYVLQYEVFMLIETVIELKSILLERSSNIGLNEYPGLRELHRTSQNNLECQGDHFIS